MLRIESEFSFLSYFVHRLQVHNMSSIVLTSIHKILSKQHWYMNSLVPEHLIRVIWCVLLMSIFSLVELDYLPGKKWKIRKDLHTSRSEIIYYVKHSIMNMLQWHILPLVVYDLFIHVASKEIIEIPTWWTILWKTLGYTFIFDLLTHTFHHVTHLHPQIASYFHRAHAVHHSSCGRYIYAWNGFYSSALEAFAGLIFFQLAMIPLRMDPITRLFSILIIHLLATNTHSGYDFPWMFHNWNWFGQYFWHGSVGHYYHHQLGRKNLSTFWTILDRLSGTYYDHLTQSPLHPQEFIYRRSVASCSSGTKKKI